MSKFPLDSFESTKAAKLVGKTTRTKFFVYLSALSGSRI